MIRTMLIGALALACVESAEAQEWRKIGGEPDPLGRVEPVRFVKDATLIEPTDSDLSVVMIVFCEEEPPKATLAVRLGGASQQGSSGAARIDGGETIDIFWFGGRGSSFMELMSGDMSGDSFGEEWEEKLKAILTEGSEAVLSFGEEWEEKLKAILTEGSEAVLSFDPVGHTKHYFRLNLAGLADRIDMCESAVQISTVSINDELSIETNAFDPWTTDDSEEGSRGASSSRTVPDPSAR